MAHWSAWGNWWTSTGAWASRSLHWQPAGPNDILRSHHASNHPGADGAAAHAGRGDDVLPEDRGGDDAGAQCAGRAADPAEPRAVRSVADPDRLHHGAHRQQGL